MIKRLIKGARKKLWKTEEQENILTPLNVNVVFELRYKDLLVGKLKLNDGIWTFAYSSDFKQQQQIRPLPDFPKLEKEYKSNELYPFFGHRIPSIKQPRVQKVIQNSEVKDIDEVTLLKLFGKHSITNPFLLQAVG